MTMAEKPDEVMLRWPKDAIVARRGDVVFVETRKAFTPREMRQIGEALHAACTRYGVQIVVLPPELKVNRIESVADTGTPGIEPDAGGTGEQTKDETK
jgi:hypothetical protein